MEGVVKALDKLERECLKVLKDKNVDVKTKRVVNEILRNVYYAFLEIGTLEDKYE